MWALNNSNNIHKYTQYSLVAFFNLLKGCYPLKIILQ